MSIRSEVVAWWNNTRTQASPDTSAELVVGLSGGADSLALVSGVLSLRREGYIRAVHTVTVDHQLQAGSHEVAEQARRQALTLGADTAEIIRVHVAGQGEAQARTARYRALGEYACGRPLLVAHTADDDAEGVLLGLARGSGALALAGMAAVTSDHPAVTAGAAWLGRPLLHSRRADTEDECTRLGLGWWEDPHNRSGRYLRSRVRHELLPVLRGILGEGIDNALSETARQLREDSDLLDRLAAELCARAEVVAPEAAPGLAASQLKNEPAPLRLRAIRHWLSGHAGALTSTHLHSIDALVTDWRGQGPVAVPYPPTSHLPVGAGENTPSGACPTMNEYRRTHRLVVARVDGTLTLTLQQRTALSRQEPYPHYRPHHSES